MSLAVKKYTGALVDIAVEENCLDEIYEQFSAVYRELCDNKDFEKLLNTRIMTTHEKKDLLEGSLKDGNPYLLNFLKLVVDKERTEELKEMFIEFEVAYKEKKNIIEATAVTAIELTEEDVASIKEMLAKKYDKTIILENKVDPSILGGMVLYVGDTVLDASVRAKLSGLRSSLKQIKLS